MVRDACLIILTVSVVGWIGYMVACDRRQRRELAGFQDRVAARIMAQWQAPPDAPELGA